MEKQNASAPSYEEAMQFSSVPPAQIQPYPNLAMQPDFNAMPQPMMTGQPNLNMMPQPMMGSPSIPIQQIPSLVQSKC